MSTPSSEYHNRILQYSDKIHLSRILCPRLPRQDRQQYRVKVAVEAPNEPKMKKDSPSMVFALRNQMEHKRKHEADLRLIDQRLFEVELDRKLFLNTKEDQQEAREQNRWNRLLSTNKEYHELLSTRRQIEQRLEQVKHDINVLRSIEEKDYNEYVVISSRRSARKSSRRQIA